MGPTHCTCLSLVPARRPRRRRTDYKKAYVILKEPGQGQ